MTDLILVDASYTSFYRFFATLRWLSHSDRPMYDRLIGCSTYDWSLCEKFMRTYTNQYLAAIKKAVGVKVYGSSKIIFCLDSRLSTVWRTAKYREYKATRPDLAKRFNFSPLFKKTKYELIPGLVDKYKNKIFSLQISCAEADDVIAVISRYYESTKPAMKVYIISGDSDFQQLGRHNLFFINYKEKMMRSINATEARRLLDLKILSGDPTDNIPPVFPGLRMGKKKELLSDNQLLKNALHDNPMAAHQYKVNKRMIDFSYIPKKIVRSTLSKLLSFNI
jgi:5'-3' exonuclease